MTKPTFTCYLDEFVKMYLGNPRFKSLLESGAVIEDELWHARPIPKRIAELILADPRHKEYCYIQMPDEFSPDIDTPVLWDKERWKEQFEAQERRKLIAKKREVERNILEANIRIVSKAFAKHTGVDSKEICDYTARVLLAQKRYEVIKFVYGVEKLITKEEEL